MPACTAGSCPKFLARKTARSSGSSRARSRSRERVASVLPSSTITSSKSSECARSTRPRRCTSSRTLPSSFQTGTTTETSGAEASVTSSVIAPLRPGQPREHLAKRRTRAVHLLERQIGPKWQRHRALAEPGRLREILAAEVEALGVVAQRVDAAIVDGRAHAALTESRQHRVPDRRRNEDWIDVVRALADRADLLDSLHLHQILPVARD